MALAPTINMAFIELLCLSRLRRTDELTPEEFAKYKQLSLRDATADAATAPPPSRSPRQGRGRNVDHQEFYDNAPRDQEVQHKFKGITATAHYVGPGNKFHYRSPDGDYDKEAGMSAFPVAHIKYLLRAGLITTGSLSVNGWTACNLPDRPKGDWFLPPPPTTTG